MTFFLLPGLARLSVRQRQYSQSAAERNTRDPQDGLKQRVARTRADDRLREIHRSGRDGFFVQPILRSQALDLPVRQKIGSTSTRL
jgi:hypothetical protein